MRLTTGDTTTLGSLAIPRSMTVMSPLARFTSFPALALPNDAWESFTTFLKIKPVSAFRITTP